MGTTLSLFTSQWRPEMISTSKTVEEQVFISTILDAFDILLRKRPLAVL